MNRTEKNEQIEQLRGVLAASPSVFLVDMTGLKVNEVTDLRRKIKGTSGACRVVKNRLAIRAAAGTPSEVLVERFRGPIGVVTTGSDPVAAAKVLDQFVKDHPMLTLRAAAIEGKLAEAEQIKTLASLPGLNELRAMFLGVLNAPATKLLRLLTTPGTQMVRALDERRGQMGGAEGDTPAAEA